MALILLIQSDFMVSSIQKSCKRKLSSFTTIKPVVNFCKGCEIIEAVAKRWPKFY